MRGTRILLIMAFVLFAIALVCSSCSSTDSQGANAKTTVYERVISTGTIRCGYVNVSVACDVDPQTGELTGTFPDIIREMAKNMGLEVEFVEEVGWGTMIAGLQTGRYDMMASPVWPNSSRVRQTTFSIPAYYSAIGVWVRPDEDRFTPAGGWAALNDPGVKIGALDGSTGETIAISQFPGAGLLTYPELANEGQIFLDVTTGKVDVFFEEPAKGAIFLENNPGQLKNIADEIPVKVFPNVFMLPGGEYRFKEMIDTALVELQNSGFVDRVLTAHEPAPGAYYRSALPYQSR